MQQPVATLSQATSDRQLSDVMNEEEQKTRLFHPHLFTKTGKMYYETCFKADALRAALAFGRCLRTRTLSLAQKFFLIGMTVFKHANIEQHHCIL